MLQQKIAWIVLYLGLLIKGDTSRDYSKIASDAFSSQNQARSDPVQFAKVLQSRGYSDAAIALAGKAACSALVGAAGLDAAAQEWVKIQGPSGNLGHFDPPPTTPETRISAFGTWLTSIGENSVYGATTGFDALAFLIGSPDHLQNIMDCSFRVGGIACGPHQSVYGDMCVMEFATGFIPRYVVPSLSTGLSRPTYTTSTIALSSMPLTVATTVSTAATSIPPVTKTPPVSSGSISASSPTTTPISTPPRTCTPLLYSCVISALTDSYHQCNPLGTAFISPSVQCPSNNPRYHTSFHANYPLDVDWSAGSRAAMR